jgi:hypothetical protein
MGTEQGKQSGFIDFSGVFAQIFLLGCSGSRENAIINSRRFVHVT